MPNTATNTEPTAAEIQRIASRLDAASGLAANTVAAYESRLVQLDAWLSDRPLDDEALALHLAWLHAKGLCYSTANQTVCAVQWRAERAGDASPVGRKTRRRLVGFRRVDAGRRSQQVDGLSWELSDDTAKDDVGSKRYACAYLGVTEYWLFDPLGLQLSTPLMGYRLDAGGRYRQIAEDAAGRHSRVLGLDLHVRAGKLRFRNPAAGEDLRNLDESERERAAEKHRADRAEDERDAAERGRVAEKVRAESEKNRADAAERELARLRMRLEGS